MLYLLALLAVVIIVALAIYATKLTRRLNKQTQFIKQARAERSKRLKESIAIIAKAMQNGDCNHSEGVIRLTRLTQPFGKDLANYPAMFELYQTVKDMPTHEARKELVKKERMKLDLMRESAEAKLENTIMLELRQLLDDVENLGEL